MDYYIINKFTIREVNGTYRLVKKNNPSVYFVCIEDIFKVIDNAHISSGHGGQKRTLYEIKHNQKVANITASQVNLFITLCLTCKKKQLKNNRHKDKVIRPILSSKFNERGQVDLIDMSSLPTRGYKYILVYQDHLTKFVILNPLKSKKSIGVYNCLIKIFTTLGCPSTLQSDNGNEFCRNKDLKKYWPQLRIVKSKPRHPQSQGSVERANGDITMILKCWLAERDTSDWVKALPFVQLQKNSAINRTIKCCPYKAVFGQDPPSLRSVFEEEEEEERVDESSQVCNDNLPIQSDCVNDDDDSNREIGDTVTTSVRDIGTLKGQTLRNVVSSPIHSVDDTPVTLDSNNLANCTAVDNNSFGRKIIADNLATDIVIPDDGNVSLSSLEFSSRPSVSTTNNDGISDNDDIDELDDSRSVPSTSNVQQSSIRQKVSKSLHLAAKKSIQKNERKRTGILELGTIVAIKIPACDLQKLSFRNLLLSICSYSKDIDKYRLQTLCKSRIVDGYFDRREFIDVYNHLNISAISKNDDYNNSSSVPIVSSLRTIVRLDNYKYIGCHCSGRCQSNVCFCKKVGKYCNLELCKHKHNCTCLNVKYEKHVKTRTRIKK